MEHIALELSSFEYKSRQQYAHDNPPNTFGSHGCVHFGPEQHLIFMSVIHTFYYKLLIEFLSILAFFRILFVQINCLFARMYFLIVLQIKRVLDSSKGSKKSSTKIKNERNKQNKHTVQIWTGWAKYYTGWA